MGIIVGVSKGYPDKFEKFKELKNMAFTNNENKQLFRRNIKKRCKIFRWW